MGMSIQTRMGVGAAMATMGALVIVLSLLLGWPSTLSPWEYVLAFGVGLIAGLGSTFAVFGLIESGHGTNR